MPEHQLPSLSAGDAVWSDIPPDPLDEPDLYDGLLLRRAVAYGLDVIVIAVILTGLWLLLSVLTIISFGLLGPVQVVIMVLTPLAYHTLFVGHGGATPGMRIMDVEIRDWRGGRPSLFQAFLAAVLFYGTIIPTSWLILLFALFNDMRRTLHDLLSGTVAVRHSRLAAGPLPA